MGPSNVRAVRAVSRRTLLGAAATHAALLAGCATGSGSAGGTAGAGQKLKTGLKFDVIGLGGGPVGTDVRNKLLEEFARMYPGLSGSYTEPANYFEKLDSLLASGTVPDVFFMNPYVFKQYAVRGALLNLAPLVKRDRVDVTDFYPVARDLFTHRGDLRGMPLHFNGINLAFNKQAFDAIGLAYPSQDLKKQVWSFDSYLEACRRLTRREGDDVQVWGTSINTSFQWYLSFVYSNGGDLVSKDQASCLLTDPPAIEALQFLQDLAHRYRVAALPADLTKSNLNVNTGFTSGKTAMFWPSGAPQFGQIRQSAQFAWDAGLLPVGKGKPATGMGAPGYTVWSGTKNPEESWVLASFLTGKQAQTAEVRAGTITPSRRSVAFSDDFLAQRPPEHLKVVSDALETIKLPPQLANWPDVQAALDREMAPFWAGTRTARDATGAAKQQLDPLLREAKRLEDSAAK